MMEHMKFRRNVPAGTPMPEPVPPGRFAEFAAAISEGFCPACRVPLDPWPLMSFGPRGDCRACGANWFLHTGAPRGIQWRSTVSDMAREIWSNGDHVRGTAVWAE